MKRLKRCRSKERRKEGTNYNLKKPGSAEALAFEKARDRCVRFCPTLSSLFSVSSDEVGTRSLLTSDVVIA